MTEQKNQLASLFAASIKLAGRLSADEHLVRNCSGRGDKDVQEAMRLLDS
jgi:tryptophan synthase beta subunit